MTHELVRAVIDARKQQHHIKHAIDELTQKALEILEESSDGPAATHMWCIKNFATIEAACARESKEIFNSVADIPFPLRFNKMPDILSGIVETVQTLGQYNTDLTYQLPRHRFDEDWKAGGYKKEFWGTSLPTNLAAAASVVYLWDTRKSFGDAFSLKSPIHHVVPLSAQDYGFLPKDSKFLYDVNEIQGYGFVHTGFAVGGSRGQEILYPKGKEWQPEDASSFTKKYTLPHSAPNWGKIGFSTADLLCVHWTKVGRYDPIPEGWAGSSDGALPRYFDEIKPEAIRPGDVYVKRGGFTPEKPLGISGISGIITDVRSNEVDILTANRDAPHVEGIGISTRNVVAEHDETVFFLRPKDSEPLHEHFSIENAVADADSHMSAQPDYVSVFGDTHTWGHE